MFYIRLGSISDQTIAGAISCAYHGTGINHKILSDSVTEIEMLLASGEVKVYNKQSEEFPGKYQLNLSLHFTKTHLNNYKKALLCSLGCLGVMLNVTIQCEAAFKLEQIEYGAKLEDVTSQWFKFN